VGRLLVIGALVALVAALDAQSRDVRLTPWGDPDIQGVWPSGALSDVPFERPVELGDRAELTDVEFLARRDAIRRFQEQDASPTPVPGASGDLNPPQHWRERPSPSRQASLVVDPKNGRLPPLTADGARRAKAWQERANGPAWAAAADFNPYDRCITRGVLGSTLPNIYGTGIEITQVPGAVVIRYEMVHETRIVPLDGRPHLSPAIRSYMGDARGRWDGATLVVETTNFNGRTGTYARNGNGNPASEGLTLVERFTRTDRTTLRYEATVNDPATWTRPWTVAFPLVADPDYEMYEYACHEGNYALGNLLRIARAAERAIR
jgi:hypothetical protein